MHFSLRVVVALLLAITVPIQGLVAATRGWCCPSPEQVAEAVPMDTGHGQAVMMAAAMPDHHQMTAHRHQSSTSANEPGQFDAELQNGGLLKVAKRHRGASCCTVAVIPSGPLVLGSVTLKELFTSFEPRGVIAFLTEGLERPPRLLLA
jgi:hypothetical protein